MYYPQVLEGIALSHFRHNAVHNENADEPTSSTNAFADFENKSKFVISAFGF